MQNLFCTLGVRLDLSLSQTIEILTLSLGSYHNYSMLILSMHLLAVGWDCKHSLAERDVRHPSNIVKTMKVLCHLMLHVLCYKYYYHLRILFVAFQVLFGQLKCQSV